MNDDSGVIYKILRPVEWEKLQIDQYFDGSSDDLRDGFVHLSAGPQVAGTLARHFADEDELILVSVQIADLGDALKWEESRGGALFPHLFAPLPLSAVRGSRRLSRGTDGRHALPDLDA